MTGLGFAVFLIKLCQKRLNGEAWRAHGSSLSDAVSTHGPTRAVHRASLVKNSSQRDCVIELTANSLARAGSLGLWRGQGSWPFGSFPFKALCRVSSLR